MSSTASLLNEKKSELLLNATCTHYTAMVTQTTMTNIRLQLHFILKIEKQISNTFVFIKIQVTSI